MSLVPMTQREQILQDAAGVMAGMAQKIEESLGVDAALEEIPSRCRWAFRLGQASGYRFASEAITETLTAPETRLEVVE